MSGSTTNRFRGRKAFEAYRKTLATAKDEADFRDCIADLMHYYVHYTGRDPVTEVEIAIRAWRAEQ